MRELSVDRVGGELILRSISIGLICENTPPRFCSLLVRLPEHNPEHGIASDNNCLSTLREEESAKISWNIKPQWVSDRVRGNGIAIDKSGDPQKAMSHLSTLSVV